MSSFHSTSRRQFLKIGTSALVVPLLGLPKRGSEASLEKIRTAHIGVGGMGASDLGSIASHKMVEVAALCDVDETILNRAHSKFKNAKVYRDFREMFSDLKDAIDAVIVSTPDHTHAAATMTAMLAGKPVYCQKPLTHEIHESRQLRMVAQEKKLISQMGVQIHSAAPYKRAVQMIRQGVIGKVSHVHAWSNKNWGYDGQAFSGEQAPPRNLDWDLWLGPAPKRAFVANKYHQGNWRKIIDFGTGTLGDMGVHIFDTPYTALKLTSPNWVKTFCREPTGVGHPEKNRVEYEFPGTQYTSDLLTWYWYDGSYAPSNPQEIGLNSEDTQAKLPGQGSLFIGESGQLLLPHIGEPILFPESKFKNHERPNVVADNHYHQFIDACLGNGKTSMGFEVAGPLTEALLLGVVANRFPGQQLDWDANQLTVTNLSAANQLIRRDYREGFKVARLSGS